MKTYNVKFVDGTNIKVRFYKTGGFTITDKNGEHEVGIWVKPSNDCFMYRGKIFEKEHPIKDWKMKDLADRLAIAWKYLKRI